MSRKAIHGGAGNERLTHSVPDSGLSALTAENLQLRSRLADADRDTNLAEESGALSRADLVTSNLALADSLEAAAFLSSVLDASQDCIKVLNLSGEIIFINSGGHQALEIDDFAEIEGCPWPTFWAGDLHAVALEAMKTALAGGIGRFAGEANTMKGTAKWWDVTVTAIRNGQGEIEHLLSISRDITEARQIALQRELLSNELSHRVKNILAVVQAIASQSFRNGDRSATEAFQ